jgi:hypothetical protein
MGQKTTGFCVKDTGKYREKYLKIRSWRSLTNPLIYAIIASENTH